jgi:Protein of unknown function (DUF1501)
MTRREMLAQSANGFGLLALSTLFSSSVSAAINPGDTPGRGTGALPALHHRARAKSVIFLYMDGGPSHVDTFDPKPRLTQENGQPFKMTIEATQFNNNGNTLGSPWKFKKHGQSGIDVSELFPHVATCADDLCLIRSMTSKFSEHTNANYFLHTGLGLAGRPSMGAWCSYGLGSVCDDLPGYIVLNGGLTPPGGLDCFASAFLPATHQGSIFRAGEMPVANITPAESSADAQQRKLALMRTLDQRSLDENGPADAIESAIANYELAFRMQSAVPQLMDLSGESEETRRLYGLEAESEHTRSYGNQCLVARRLVERGVRFIELTCPGAGNDRWDQHGDLRRSHAANALAVDQPIAALLKDLKRRGMLDDTLVIWGGEFGRTPFAQGTDNGRDHNPFGFSMWMAGGGSRPGTIYGGTDEYGYKAIDRPLEIHDLHATMLHLLGVNHTRLTVPFSGRDMRLTDVHGNVIKELLA